MRYLEIAGGLRTIVNNEEAELVRQITENDNQVTKSSLDERQREVARRLTSRGVLNRTKDKDVVYYSVNRIKPSWRD